MDPLTVALGIINVVLIEAGIAELLGGRKEGDDGKDDDANDPGPMCAS
jgi:hypothetical protein